jgi:hypothetical protein
MYGTSMPSSFATTHMSLICPLFKMYVVQPEPSGLGWNIASVPFLQKHQTHLVRVAQRTIRTMPVGISPG